MHCHECGDPIRRWQAGGELTVTAVCGGRAMLIKATLLPAGIRPGDRLNARVAKPGAILLYVVGARPVSTHAQAAA